MREEIKIVSRDKTIKEMTLPRYGSIKLVIQDGKIFRIIKEESEVIK